MNCPALSQVSKEDHMPTSKAAMDIWMNQDTFTLDEGQVVLQWPSRISPENYDDLKDWLDLMARRIKRAVKAESSDAC